MMTKIFVRIACCTLALAATPISAVYAIPAVHRSCLVSIDTGDGEWTASRHLTVRGSEVETSRDSFQWKPREAIVIDADSSLQWELNYYWPKKVTDNKAIEDSDVSVLLYFDFKVSKEHGEPRKPDQTWLHVYRSTNADERRLAPTSMSSRMWWDKFNGSVSGKASMPLDHLLAFGQGFDTLAWEIQSAPNELGTTQKLAKGTLPIVAMRDRTDAIFKLRKMLDQREKRYVQECDIPLTVAQ